MIVKKLCLSLFILSFVFSLFGKEPPVSKQIEDDLQSLKTYLSQGYVLYDDAVNNGFDLVKVNKLIKSDYNKNVKDKSKLDSEIFGWVLYLNLFENLDKANIVDMHTGIQFGDHGFLNYYGGNCICWSNIYFEKKGNDYYVLKSNVSNIKQGQKYTGDISNLFRDYSFNTETYRFAKTLNIQKEDPKALISINNQGYEIQLYENKLIRTKSNHLSFIEGDTFVYISASDTNLNTDSDNVADRDAAWNRIYEIENNLVHCNKSKDFIIDLRSNAGGYNDILCHFIAPIFYGKKYENAYSYKNTEKLLDNGKKYLHSELLNNVEKPGERYYTGNVLLSRCKLDLRDDVLQGNVFFLVNRNTASSCEAVINISKCINKSKVVLIGENTMGCNLTSNSKHYILPNSKVVIKLPYTSYKESNYIYNLESYKGESYGFIPDYWTTNDSLLDTLSFVMKNTEILEKLSNLEEELQ